MKLNTEELGEFQKRHRVIVKYSPVKICMPNGKISDFVAVDKNDELVAFLLEPKPSNTFLLPGSLLVYFDSINTEFLFENIPPYLSEMIFDSKTVNLVVVDQLQIEFYIDIEKITVFFF